MPAGAAHAGGLVGVGGRREAKLDERGARDGRA